MAIYVTNKVPFTRYPDLLSRFNTLNLTNIKDIYTIDILDDSKVEGIIFDEFTGKNLLSSVRSKGIPCMFYSSDRKLVSKYINDVIPKHERSCSRTSSEGYEVTTRGDRRFSPFCIRYKGMTLENYYQLGIKGGGVLGYFSWKDCKGKPPYFLEIVENQDFTDNTVRLIHAGLSTFDEFPLTTKGVESKNTLEVCKLWRDELIDILQAYRSGEYERVELALSSLTQVPEIHFESFINMSRNLGLIYEDGEFKSEYPRINIHGKYKEIYTDWLMSNPELLIELLELTRDNRCLTDMFWYHGISQAKVLSEILNEVLEL